MTTTLLTPEATNVTPKYMSFEAYQEKIKDFRLPSYGPEAAVMGLLSEGGEVAGVFQKLIRGDYTTEEAMARLYKELGDVLWHVAAIASDNDWNVTDILLDNIDKLESRKLRSTLLGDGDNR